MNCWKYC